MRQLPVLRSIPAASCAAILVACLHNEGPTTTAPLFATTTIDSTVGTAATTSLVVDVSQHVHVLYSQDGVSTLRGHPRSGYWDHLSNQRELGRCVAGGAIQAGIVYLSAGSSQSSLRFAQSN